MEEDSRDCVTNEEKVAEKQQQVHSSKYTSKKLNRQQLACFRRPRGARPNQAAQSPQSPRASHSPHHTI